MFETRTRTISFQITVLLSAVLSVTAIPHSRCPCRFYNESQTMDCSRQNLTSVPICATSAMNTEHLDISVNSIADIPPKTFISLSNLRSLNLSHNIITHAGNLTFEGLANVLMLNLAFNRLGEVNSFEVGVFKPLTRLQTLFIQGNLYPSGVYPDIALSEAKMVTNLSIDGLPRTLFGSGFGRMQNLRVLTMNGDDGYCHMDEILPNTFVYFRDTPLQTIEILDCRIDTIQPNTFEGLGNLTRFTSTYARGLCGDIIDNITTGLNTTSIKRLELIGLCPNGLTVRFGADTFKGLTNTALEVLILANDKIEYIYPECIHNLPNTLTYFSLRYNFIDDVHFLNDLVILNNLKVFDISFQNNYNAVSRLSTNKTLVSYTDNRLPQHDHQKRGDSLSDSFENRSTLPEHASESQLQQIDSTAPARELNQDNKHSTSKSVNSQDVKLTPPKIKISQTFLWKNLTLKTFKTPTDSRIHLPPNVRNIYMSNLKLDTYAVIPLTFAPNSLHYLDMSACQLRGFLGPWVGLHQLKFINMSYNRFSIMHPRSFSDMRNLRTLLLQHNEIGLDIMKLDRKGELFANLTILETLDLGNNVIKALPSLIFRNQRRLSNLSLAENALTNIEFTLGTMIQLKLFNLSGNQLSELPVRACKELNRIASMTDLRLDLRGNPLMCDCDHMDFVDWLVSTGIVLIGRSNMTCRYTNGSLVSLNDINYVRNQFLIECYTKTFLAVSGISLAGLLITILLVAVCYHKRWQLRYLYIKNRRTLNPYHPLVGDKIEITNDVYISFEPDYQFNDDTSMDDFVKQELYPYLVNKGLGVVIQDDLQGEAGQSMDALITNTLRRTRKVIALLTSTYCNSNAIWNVWEFNLAVYEGIHTKRAVVVPVVVGEITPDDFRMHPEIKSYLKSMEDDVLRFSGGEGRTDSFFKALCDKLND